ncbi:LEAF RUST 10 DISEASE-RESISTANCE LOCUS RECEPTOR-LIKE PROTEIN KINASE-like 1.3 isoform X3 [Mercurialis annua]|uniref:LEAF RUST 10 DISEASE-RESISTANCE LOCUS RECEPTOR-LIKE PROTEIN KINASE-like 1.3 isoform X3 n=1 Tax=Mercurialis annua TaxID=3986 RepID=UPI00215EC3C1|nr:LEAF RUST 10 DISEASE-RESISTANCE LOCUS RECEPTOR-LIKE PROTEIN KINASE-like 1.3 isoform X3 [Mercurialis annua]
MASSLIFSLPVSVFFVFLLIPTGLSKPELYTACRNIFSCRNITASYPFWGKDRPDACGIPEMKLECQNGNSIIEIESVSYRVLEVIEKDQILRIARQDYLSGICQPKFMNTTLDSAFFELASNYRNLTIFYGCPSGLDGIFNAPLALFNCDIEGSVFNGGYAAGGVNGPGLCYRSVVVPVSEFTLTTDIFNFSVLQVSLKQGFEVKWKADHTLCNDCLNSDGACGYDVFSNQSVCYCDGQSIGSKSCSSSPDMVSSADPGGNSSKAPIAIGLSVAGVAVVVGIGLGVWFLLFVQRRKRASSPTSSKDLLTPPSSKSQSAPVTNFSQTIPSYPSSKSDLEKGSLYFGTQVFSYDELVEATDNFDPSRELGDGGFGTVYYGVLNDGRIVAVKRLFENNIKRAEQFMNEIEILTRLRHKNLVALYGCTSKRSRELVLVYEYISNGTVADHLHGNRTKSSLLPWKVRLSIAIETADALAYLHASDVIHRDVKTNNILLDSNFSVKVADFGLSRLFPNDVSHVSTAPQGTPGYVDPEYYQCYQLTDKSDVYSFGVVLTELLSSLQAVDTSRHRLDINLANMAVSKIQNHAINELVDPMLGFEKDYLVRKMTTSVAELAFRCLQQEKDMRPTMAEVLQALKKIESEDFGSEKVEVLDIKDDDAVLLNHVAPFSPDDESIPTDKWVSSSSITTNTTISF